MGGWGNLRPKASPLERPPPQMCSLATGIPSRILPRDQRGAKKMISRQPRRCSWTMGALEPLLLEGPPPTLLSGGNFWDRWSAPRRRGAMAPCCTRPHNLPLSSTDPHRRSLRPRSNKFKIRVARLRRATCAVPTRISSAARTMPCSSDWTTNWAEPTINFLIAQTVILPAARRSSCPTWTRSRPP